MRRALFMAAAALLAIAVAARADPVTFTAAGSPHVVGYIQIDDSAFAGGTFEAIPNTAITGLSLTVLGNAFTLSDVATGGITYINSSGAVPLIVNGGGPFATRDLLAIAFFPDGAGGTASDGDASLALDLNGDFTTPEHIFAVRWTTALEPDALLQQLLNDVIGVGPGGSLANKVRMAQTYYTVPDLQATCSMLKAFMLEVGAQSGKKLTTGQAGQFAADAEAIRVAIGCE